MKLENTFVIAVPLQTAWDALNNPETVAPCFPGATLTDYTGDSFTGVVKVKLGPISMTYNGTGTYLDRDDAAHSVIIDAHGRDARGNGTAGAKVTATLQASGPDKTEVRMVTDMNITGRPAQFGRGVIADVADRMIGQFATCLADKLSASGPDVSSSRNAGGDADARVKNSPAANDAIDLLGAAGGPLARAALPAAGVTALLLVLVAVVLAARRPRN